MEKEKLELKKGDVCIIFFVVMIIAISLLLITNKKQGDCVHITVDGETKTYPLAQNDMIVLVDGEWQNSKVYADVHDTDRTNIVVIDHGQVYMKEANCPDRICVKHTPVSKHGEMIICLPHKVFVEIESNVASEIDN